jgi:NTP pyrophosphatase (non-canonical NTP hydrolase)
MSSLQEYTDKLVELRRERDWEQFDNGKDEALSLVLEATEVLEHFQWKNGEVLKKYLDEHREEIGEELADVFYWVVLMSHDLGIDILDAADKKLEKIKAKYPVEKAKGRSEKYDKL